jgi:hypothetical protein
MSSEIQRQVPGADEMAAERRRSGRAMQVVFAVLSLGMLTAGLAINWFAVSAGFSREIIDIAAYGMLRVPTITSPWHA